MALNFPSSPTNGQQYQNWIYDSAKGAWEAKPLEAMAATPSPTAPLTPQSGDMWYNTNDGGVYVYYNDGNTSQWVQMKSDATLSSTLGERTTTLENKLGLSRIIPPTIVKSGGSVEVNTAGTISFTAVTSLSINDVFSTTYSKYRILMSGLVASANVDIYGRFRVSGSDSATTYYESIIEASNTTLGSTATTAATNFRLAVVGTNISASSSHIIHNPAIVQYTNFSGQQYGSVATQIQKLTAGYHATNAAYTGITLNPSSGTISGKIQILGYND